MSRSAALRRAQHIKRQQYEKFPHQKRYHAHCAGYHHRRGRDFAGHLRRRARSRIRHLPPRDGAAHAPQARASTLLADAARRRHRLGDRLFGRRQRDPCAVSPVGNRRHVPLHRAHPRHAARPLARGGHAGARQRFVHLADRQLPRPVRRADGRQVQFICRDARKLLGLSLLRRAVGLQLHHPGDDVVVHPDGGRPSHAADRRHRAA